MDYFYESEVFDKLQDVESGLFLFGDFFQPAVGGRHGSA